MTVTAYDAYGNVATGYTGTVALTQHRPARRAAVELHVHLPPTRASRAFP